VTSCLASPYPSSNGWLARLQICIDWDALIFATKCGVDISGSINPSVLETNELERGRLLRAILDESEVKLVWLQGAHE
jgi:hypothetical protein